MLLLVSGESRVPLVTGTEFKKKQKFKFSLWGVFVF
jgi:hypothetical protein